jgi:hypothetical protein
VLRQASDKLTPVHILSPEEITQSIDSVGLRV